VSLSFTPTLRQRVKGRVLTVALPYAVFALLCAVSWNRWIEPYIDTGRELMVPARMAEGEKLYRDIQFPHGPLAPFLAAGIDRLAGRSLPARTAFAALVALLHLSALGRLSRRILSPGRAALATSAAVAAAVFLRPGGWLFPFSFDTAIAVAALTWALAFETGNADRRPGAAAFCLLVALLARLEMGLAGVAVLALSVWREPVRLLRVAVFPLTAAAVAYGAFSLGLSRGDLVADGWLRLIDPPEAFQNVYRAYAGLDRVGLRSVELLLAAMVLLVVASWLAACALVASRLAAMHRSAAATVQVLSIAVLAAAAAVRFRPPDSLADRLALFPPLVRVIPPCLVVAALLRVGMSLRGRLPAGPLAAVPDAVLWIAALFSARLLLAAGYVGPYDAFFLPLPILVASAGLFAMADRAAASAGAALPRLAFAALGVFLLFRLASMAELYRRPGWSTVKTPAGSLVLTEPVATTTRLALLDLGRRLPSGATLVGFPETGFFDYVLGTRNPLPIEQFFPGTLDAAGEQRVIAQLGQRGPDAILYANVLAVGEGARIFGKDYLVKLDQAVRSRYRTAAVYGLGARAGARIGDPEFFVELLLPKAAP
jgi:hypothetical protein